MYYFADECCGCAMEGYPCLKDACPNINVIHFCCDGCGEETQLYHFDGDELCIDCIEQLLDKVN